MNCFIEILERVHGKYKRTIAYYYYDGRELQPIREIVSEWNEPHEARKRKKTSLGGTES
jgi:hypothetical protein